MFARKGKSKRNYMVDMLAFFPFLFLIVTGFILLPFHEGKSLDENMLILSGHSWMLTHKVLAVVSFALIIIHLWLHWKWIKKWFTGGLKSKHRTANKVLFILFVLTSFTGLFSWLITSDFMFVKFHNKLGILLTILFIIHIKHYFFWLLSMTKKILANPTNS